MSQPKIGIGDELSSSPAARVDRPGRWPVSGAARGVVLEKRARALMLVRDGLSKEDLKWATGQAMAITAVTGLGERCATSPWLPPIPRPSGRPMWHRLRYAERTT